MHLLKDHTTTPESRLYTQVSRDSLTAVSNNVHIYILKKLSQTILFNF